MAEKHFSWLPEEINIEKGSNLSSPLELPHPKNFLLQKFYDFKTSIVVCAALLVAILAMRYFQPQEASTSYKLESVAAFLPIPKGKVIEGMLLRPATINPGSISKAQRLDLLTLDDAEKVMGKVRAKKDLPPNKPIFWSELELLPERKTNAATPLPKVIFSEDIK